MIQRLSLPVQLLIMIGMVLLLGSYFNETVVRFFYTLSLCFKEFLGFLLPFIIFSFVFTGIVALRKNAPIILIVLLASILLSNACVSLVSYGFAQVFLPHIVGSLCAEEFACTTELQPLVQFALPFSLRADLALLMAVLLGLIFSFFTVPVIENSIGWLKKKLEYFFKNIFIPLLPLYVVGFLLKIQYEGVLVRLIQHYGGAFFLIVSLQILYLLFFYYSAVGFSLSRATKALKNASASYLTAFGTMSSTATVPVSVECAEKNTGNRSLAQISMPIMANIHLLGDSIGTPILAMVTMLLFLGALPGFIAYGTFVLYFCLSMFAVSGIPGGGIIVMIPVLKTYLGFTPEMISIMMTLYLLMDAFGTAANVMGDGALVIIVNKILKRLKLV